MSKYLYILDNGHGFNTKNKRSKVWQDGTQLLEYQFNRDVVKLLSFMLRKNKIDYEILVPELKNITLKERVRRANKIKIKSILISIHGNWFTDSKVNGFETHYYSKSGKKIANIFQNEIKILGKDRGLKKSNFYILKYTHMTAILTENGFY